MKNSLLFSLSSCQNSTRYGPVDYVSDDDFAPPARKNPHAGVAAIARMADNWEENRRRASNIIRSLQSGTGAPGRHFPKDLVVLTAAGTVDMYDRWINRFDLYR
jgi:hypothetical protein